MAANYVLLEKITVGAAGASSVSFTGIPQTGYTDLVVKVSARTSDASNYQSMYMTVNGGAQGSVLSQKWINGNGTAVVSSGYNSIGQIYPFYINGSSSTSNTFGNGEIYITNYASTTTNKSISTDGVTENNATDARAELDAILFASNSAITSLLFGPGAGSFAANSTFYLYGVAKLGTTPAIVPYATGGDTIMTDGTYWYHTFLSSGTFTPTKALSADYLVVAGGGGGGKYWGGGGGAGGLRSTVTATGGGGSLETPLSLSTTAYTVTIGAGGAAASVAGNGTSGNNSVFSTITSTGGGAGAGSSSTGVNGISGGSGGGARCGSGSETGGAGTANQGYRGGNNAGATGGGTGGGGAGAVGGTVISSTGGNGGNGVATSISGSSVTYAGGGGGSFNSIGTGGTGGGGNGANDSQNATSGTANTGSGGGGGSGGYAAGAGGSGIVIVRYAV